MHPAKPHAICGVRGGWAWSILLILAFLFGVPYVQGLEFLMPLKYQIGGVTALARMGDSLVNSSIVSLNV
jgi:hypothetical protein